MHTITRTLGIALAATLATGIGFTSARASPAAPTIDDLAWLAGDREQRHDTGVARETWIGPAGGVLLGMSLTTRPGKSAQYEHLRITADSDGTLAYFSIPSGQAPSTFRLKSLDATHVVFENATHDFPQRILYTDLGEGRVRARIEGEIGGKARSAEWTFTPIGR